MLNVAIAGYGNLGKSLEKEILKDSELNLVAIFSRRNIDHKLAMSFDGAKQQKNIDVVLLALGSYADICDNLHYFSDFDTVDSYDTHAKIASYKTLLNDVKPDKISVCCVGWDPGILSIVRGLFSVGGEVATFWGSGISQGHSNALRSIKGVLDAVEITVPNEDAKQSFADGIALGENKFHNRLCYVSCVESDKARVEKEIRSMPNYFANQNVDIIFCSSAEVRKIKQQTQHAGEVIARGDGFSAKTSLQIESNTDYTAKVMLAYAKTIPQLKKDGFKGAADPYDIPLKYIADLHLI